MERMRIACRSEGSAPRIIRCADFPVGIFTNPLPGHPTHRQERMRLACRSEGSAPRIIRCADFPVGIFTNPLPGRPTHRQERMRLACRSEGSAARINRRKAGTAWVAHPAGETHTLLVDELSAVLQAGRMRSCHAARHGHKKPSPFREGLSASSP